MTTRRTVLKAGLATGATMVFSGAFSGLKAFAQTNLRVRRSLHGMSPDDPDLAAYRDFVGIMLNEKDQNDPVSWLQYSLMHGRYLGAYRYCPHGDWYFLPWHREFVNMYENAAIALTHKADFAMPYWDWTVDRTIPQPFLDKTYNGKPNPLYVEGRTLHTSDWPLRDDWVSEEKLQTEVYDETNFQLFGTSKNPEQDDLNMDWVVTGGGFQGFLEKTPHNLIHNAIGKYMPSAGSPRDPIFMMHHGNIDRIWAVWNALGRSNTADMTPADRNLWLNMHFEDNYISPTGQLYGKHPRELEDIHTMGYTYPNLPQPDGRIADPGRDKRLMSVLFANRDTKGLQDLHVLTPLNIEAATIDKPLVKQMRLAAHMKNLLVDLPETNPASAEMFAIIRDINFGSDVSSVRVFVNANSPTQETPLSDPHFAGEIGFLAHPDADEHDHKGHKKTPPSALLEITDTVRKLAKLGRLRNNDISVSLLPVLRHGARNSGKAKVIPAAVEVVLV